MRLASGHALATLTPALLCDTSVECGHGGCSSVEHQTCRLMLYTWPMSQVVNGMCWCCDHRLPLVLRTAGVWVWGLRELPGLRPATCWCRAGCAVGQEIGPDLQTGPTDCTSVPPMPWQSSEPGGSMDGDPGPPLSCLQEMRHVSAPADCHQVCTIALAPDSWVGAHGCQGLSGAAGHGQDVPVVELVKVASVRADRWFGVVRGHVRPGFHQAPVETLHAVSAREVFSCQRAKCGVFARPMPLRALAESGRGARRRRGQGE
ncbi:hypothetical protein HaLaN_24335 [Haematococcus lacustris]|uniref:Uncharacterized protein n=1 Tax=Haematococcus lacustris TaxID=44745 RepID=A0A699ZW79_HAELA|nr:hypothetical protein HaLaN_24335 [Haematococcus lacustris]